MHFVEAKGILSAQNGMNIYRGCTHGCIYCDSRSRCYGFTHDFEDIEVKRNAPALLEAALRGKREKCMIGTGAMCDPYLHCEEQLRLTRQCLEIIDRYGFGAAVQTKSARVLRDLDLFESIHEKAKCVIQMTLTTYDDDLCRILEPHVSPTSERFSALCTLRDHSIPTVVWLTPTLPFINDSLDNLRGLLQMCISANVKGIICYGGGLTLREGDREYFYQKLDEHFPGLKKRYCETYGNAYELPIPEQAAWMRVFTETCEKYGILCNPDDCFRYLHAFPQRSEQLSLF